VTATSVPVTSTPLVSLTPTATRPVTNTRTPSPSRTATRTQTPSRTRTASHTATPRPDWMTRVGNGDFELGNLIWFESSSNYPAVIVNDGRIKARSGKYYAWLGGNNNEASLIQQSITVPSDAPYLRIYYMLASTEKCGMRYDTAQITINGTPVLNGDIELCNRNTVRAWKAFTVDMRSFAGQTVTFDVRVSTDESIVSSLWLDDIGFVRLPTDAINYYGKRVTTSNYAPRNVIQR
ncbi:MAG: hypothetical protein ACKO83_03160, partial [Roseiflexaceae bacterium]